MGKGHPRRQNPADPVIFMHKHVMLAKAGIQSQMRFPYDGYWIVRLLFSPGR